MSSLAWFPVRRAIHRPLGPLLERRRRVRQRRRLRAACDRLAGPVDDGVLRRAVAEIAALGDDVSWHDGRARAASTLAGVLDTADVRVLLTDLQVPPAALVETASPEEELRLRRIWGRLDLRGPSGRPTMPGRPEAARSAVTVRASEMQLAVARELVRRCGPQHVHPIVRAVAQLPG